jgi:DNA-directed RNA polymerase I, II, and III subunit RPABC1
MSDLSCSRTTLSFYTHREGDPGDQIFIFYSDDKSVAVKTMRKYDVDFRVGIRIPDAFGLRFLDILSTKLIQRGIIIYGGNMTPAARKVRYSRELHPMVELADILM